MGTNIRGTLIHRIKLWMIGTIKYGMIAKKKKEQHLK